MQERVFAVLSLVLPKGSLERATLDLFDAADLTVRRSSDRDYHASIDDPRIERVRFLRPQEIPSYIERGLFDLGITGRDWITETGAESPRWASCTTPRPPSQPIRVVLAVPQNAPVAVGDRPAGGGPDLHRAARADQRGTWRRNGVKAMVIPSHGATEAKVPDIVDAIVDLTETGSSLRRNGLRILDTLLTSYTELVANTDAYARRRTSAPRWRTSRCCCRGAIQARGNVLLKLNVAAAQLEAVTGDAARAVLADHHHAGPRRDERGGDRGAQARGQHADPGAEGGRAPGTSWRSPSPRSSSRARP